MSFEQILEAAKRQDRSQLKQAMDKVCIDVCRSGVYDFSAAAQLASEKDLKKNIAAINFLIGHGANINYIALGAAFGEHREYAEDLLGRGANINNVAMGAAVGGHRAYAEELLGGGADINYAARGAGQGGHRAYVEELLGRGANINYAARGAAQSGHREYVEELLVRGANLYLVARGAAQGGYRAYAEELLGRSADINNVAMGAALGGHRAYAEELLGRGADINYAAKGAGQGGHRAYAEELLNRGADINWVASGAAHGRHILKGDVKNQISYLSFFSPEIIPKLMVALRDLNEPIDIDENTQKRIIAISKYMRQSNISYAFAFTRTDPNCAGMLFLLMKIVMKKNFFSAIPLDIWTHVFSFVTPLKLSRQELTSLGFTMGRTYLAAQLLFYQSDSQSNHGERAKSFHEAVILANGKEIFTQLVVEQSPDKEYKKAIENKTEDKFHRIIGFWKQELTGEDVELEEKNIMPPKI